MPSPSKSVTTPPAARGHAWAGVGGEASSSALAAVGVGGQGAPGCGDLGPTTHTRRSLPLSFQHARPLVLQFLSI